MLRKSRALHIMSRLFILRGICRSCYIGPSLQDGDSEAKGRATNEKDRTLGHHQVRGGEGEKVWQGVGQHLCLWLIALGTCGLD